MTASRAAETAQFYSNIIRSTIRMLMADPSIGDWVSDLAERSVYQSLNDGVPQRMDPIYVPFGMARELADDVYFKVMDEATRRLWAVHRTVYDFDSDLWHELGDPDLSFKMPQGVLKYLPHPDPFIVFPSPIYMQMEDNLRSRVDGFLVTGRRYHADRDAQVQVSTASKNASGRIGLMMMGRVETATGKPVMAFDGVQDVMMSRVTLDMGVNDEPMTLGEMIEKISARFVAMGDSRFDEAVAPIVVRAATALMYLCATNRDLQPLSACTGKRKPGKNASKPPKVFAVGYQVGAALRAYRRASQQSAGTGVGGWKMPPGVRRAHQHTYRVGPGRKGTEIKWLFPIPINMSKAAESPTVHRVPKKKKES